MMGLINLWEDSRWVEMGMWREEKREMRNRMEKGEKRYLGRRRLTLRGVLFCPA